MLCTTSPVARSIAIGPRGLSQVLPFMAETSALPSLEPPVLFSAW